MNFTCPICGKEISELQIEILAELEVEKHAKTVFGTVPLGPDGYKKRALAFWMTAHECKKSEANNAESKKIGSEKV